MLDRLFYYTTTLMPVNRRYVLTEQEWDLKKRCLVPDWKNTYLVTPQKLSQFMGFNPTVIQRARNSMWLLLPGVLEWPTTETASNVFAAWLKDADAFKPFRVATLRFHPSPHLSLADQSMQRPSMFQSLIENKCGAV